MTRASKPSATIAGPTCHRLELHRQPKTGRTSAMLYFIMSPLRISIPVSGPLRRPFVALQVRPAGHVRPARRAAGGGQASLLHHLLELGPGRHLLGEQRGLDAVEEALKPAHELGLGDA